MHTLGPLFDSPTAAAQVFRVTEYLGMVRPGSLGSRPPGNALSTPAGPHIQAHQPPQVLPLPPEIVSLEVAGAGRAL